VKRPRAADPEPPPDGFANWLEYALSLGDQTPARVRDAERVVPVREDQDDHDHRADRPDGVQG
jgi:hypothetical protein